MRTCCFKLHPGEKPRGKEWSPYNSSASGPSLQAQRERLQLTVVIYLASGFCGQLLVSVIPEFLNPLLQDTVGSLQASFEASLWQSWRSLLPWWHFLEWYQWHLPSRFSLSPPVWKEMLGFLPKISRFCYKLLTARMHHHMEYKLEIQRV